MPRTTSSQVTRLFHALKDAHRRNSDEWIRRMEVPAERLPRRSH
jgi:hypothetical protein